MKLNRASLCVFRRLFYAGAFWGALTSCGKKADSNLVVSLVPSDSIVLEFDAYSCTQIVTGIVGVDGQRVGPDIKGPVVLFNKMTMEWKKTSKLYIHDASIRFRGSGIQGGEAVCNITADLPALFESSAAGNSSYYSNGGFIQKGKVTSNPNCRVACSLPLANPDVPEISATGELTVKASEVANEGTDDEKYYRVKSRVTVHVRP